MFSPSIIFQRTHEGRDEIKQKSHGLTQSERLVLIMVDGVSTYQEVRDKLPALTDDRFNRALRKLEQKELVLEVFMPMQGEAPEELEPAVIDRFLQQDPLDPVTIIMFDPEDELAGISAPAVSPYRPEPVSAPEPAPQASVTSTAVSDVQKVPAPTAPVSVIAPIAAPSAPIVAMDEVHNEMADSLAQELRQRQMERPPRIIERAEPLRVHVSPPPAPPRKSLLQSVHWGYWMMGVGSAFIVAYFLAKIGS